MIIHVVQPGETISSIADNYGIAVVLLMQQNGKTDLDQLVVGESLIIIYPEITHTVQNGDTLVEIAEAHGVTVMDLLRNNPFLCERESIYPGEELVISFRDDKIMKITTNGYAYPFINRCTLSKTLPFLTYLTIFNYNINEDGSINDINDIEIIEMAKAYGVAPIMLLSTLTESGTIDINVAHNILISEEKQNTLIENALGVLRQKGYYGLNIDFQYIFPSDRQLFVDFVEKTTNLLNREGHTVIVTLTPSTFQIETGILDEGLDYAGLGQVSNGVIILSYEWGTSLGLPLGILPFNTIKYVLDYAVTQIPPEKISLGIPIIGYMWPRPFVAGLTKANAVSKTSAIMLASQIDEVIQYDDTSQGVFFTYGENDETMVFFKDVRSFIAIVNLVPELGFHGIGIWNIMQFIPEIWYYMNSQFEIVKVFN